MTIHRGSFIVVAGLAFGVAGCASNIGTIHLAGVGEACSATASAIKVKPDDKDAKLSSMAWVVSNWCTIQREVQIVDFTKDKQKVASPLNLDTCSLKVDVAPGRIKVINCFVLEEAKAPAGKYHYVIKLDKSTVVDPELIIKR